MNNKIYLRPGTHKQSVSLKSSSWCCPDVSKERLEPLTKFMVADCSSTHRNARSQGNKVSRTSKSTAKPDPYCSCYRRRRSAKRLNNHKSDISTLQETITVTTKCPSKYKARLTRTSSAVLINTIVMIQNSPCGTHAFRSLSRTNLVFSGDCSWPQLSSSALIVKCTSAAVSCTPWSISMLCCSTKGGAVSTLEYI